MHNRQSKMNKLLLIPLIVVLALGTWHLAGATAPSLSHPAQVQVLQILPALRDSEAEHASGAYFPGLGAFFSLELLRGPNTVPNQPAHQGTRDWAIYLMQQFGPRLAAVPPTEQIAMSISFYDFTTVSYSQLVVNSAAADVADPTRYQYWLNGQPYDQATGAVPPAAPTETSKPTQTPLAPTAPPAPATATPAAASDPTQASAWRPVGGTWAAADGSYGQSELGRYDLISYFNRPVQGNYRWQTELQLVEGRMGGGLVFNAPGTASKNGAHMVSYTAEGNYLQWGYFNDQGVFQFQGGVAVAAPAAEAWQTLAVEVTGERYRVLLNGKALAANVPLTRTGESYAGLLASTSHVRFREMSLTEAQP
jgi:hypothetical protein